MKENVHYLNDAIRKVAQYFVAWLYRGSKQYNLDIAAPGSANGLMLPVNIKADEHLEMVVNPLGEEMLPKWWMSP